MMPRRRSPALEFEVGPDAVIEGYKRDIDRTLLRENLCRTSARLTQDVDVVYSRTAPTLERLAAVLALDCLCLGLERLIVVKRAAGRPRDLEAVAGLEALLEERARDS